MRPGLGLQVGDVDVAVLVTGDRDDFESGHDGAGRVGAVGRGGNETHVPMRLATALVISANDQQPGVFTL